MSSKFPRKISAELGVTMKNIYLSALFLLSGSVFAAPSIVGTYKGSGPYADSLYLEIQSGPSGKYDVYLHINSKNCTGKLDEAKGELTPGGVVFNIVQPTPESVIPCVLQASIKSDGTLSLVEQSSCASFHGVSCVFDGMAKKVSSDTAHFNRLGAQKKAPPITEADTPSTGMADVIRAVSQKNAPSIAPTRNLTRIESSPVGARIIINSEYVGTAPVSVDMSRYIGTTQSSSIEVKATPAGNGCVQMEWLHPSNRLPNRMFFDTRLCPINRSIDLNIK